MPLTHAYGSVKSRKMRFLATSILLIASVGLSACANLSTVSRTTWLGPPLDKRAIHLDAQQRLVLVRGEKYCAEPSPDALASYAAALSLSVRKPGAGAASLAQSLQSNAASIGLRTQSITLMRDALYRVCEATANGTLGRVGAATALARSQDLTAVLLAVEQLTGVVAADQVILTSEAGAKASAALIETQKNLKAAEKAVNREQKELSKAEEQQTEAEAAVQQKQETVEEAKVERDDAETAERQESTEEQSKLEEAEEAVERQKDAHQEAEETRDIIRDIHEEIQTQATTDSAGGFVSTPIQRNQLDATATTAIADAVTRMVTEVLDKNYTLESCTALITDYSTNMTSTDQKRILTGCTDLVLSDYHLRKARAEEETAQAELRKTQAEEETARLQRLMLCPLDEDGEKIEKMLKKQGQTLRDNINQWLRKKYGTRLGVVLEGCGYASIRKAVIKHFPPTQEEPNG